MHPQSSASSEADVVTESSEVYPTFILGYAYALSYFSRTLSCWLLVCENIFLHIMQSKKVISIFRSDFAFMHHF